MPRITVAGGPSNPDALPGETGYIAPPEEADEVRASVEEPAPEAEPEAVEESYEDWTVEQLKEELGKRDLAKSGKRDDLVARLRKDDTAQVAEE